MHTEEQVRYVQQCNETPRCFLFIGEGLVILRVCAHESTQCL